MKYCKSDEQLEDELIEVSKVPSKFNYNVTINGHNHVLTEKEARLLRTHLEQELDYDD